MPEPNTPGGPIDPSKLPPGYRVKIAYVRFGADAPRACRYAWLTGFHTYDDNDGEGPYTVDVVTSFGEYTGGYGYLTNQGLEPYGTNLDGFVFCSSDPNTASPSPSPSPSPRETEYKGGSVLPPPRRNKECDCMNCGCDCNDIATMLARQLAEYNRQIEDLKDFIQKTAVEEVKIHQKQLESITINLDLQPVVNRINEVESNLWNGIKK